MGGEFCNLGEIFNLWKCSFSFQWLWSINGNPLQLFFAWWPAVYGVTLSQAWLKWLSSMKHKAFIWHEHSSQSWLCIRKPWAGASCNRWLGPFWVPDSSDKVPGDTAASGLESILWEAIFYVLKTDLQCNKNKMQMFASVCILSGSLMSRMSATE